MARRTIEPDLRIEDERRCLCRLLVVIIIDAWCALELFRVAFWIYFRDKVYQKHGSPPERLTYYIWTIYGLQVLFKDLRQILLFRVLFGLFVSSRWVSRLSPLLGSVNEGNRQENQRAQV